jgi:very-short-patch-repair endonuclease
MGGMNRAKARELRKNPTEAERVLWWHLRLRQLEGYKFRRQQPVGPYIVDFVCFENRLVIELDGGQHGEQVAYDTERSAWLRAQGLRGLRFWNHEVLQDIEAVKRVIREAVLPPPSSSPTRGEEILATERP